MNKRAFPFPAIGLVPIVLMMLYEGYQLVERMYGRVRGEEVWVVVVRTNQASLVRLTGSNSALRENVVSRAAGLR